MGITVPRIEPTVGITSNPTPRATGLSADAFGAGLGQGMQQLGQDIENVATFEKANADAGMVSSGLKQLDDLEIAKTTEANSLTGQSALGSADVHLKDWTEGVTKIRASLVNDTQKTAFDKIEETRRKSFAMHVIDHETKQSQIFNIGEAKSAVDSAVNRVNLYNTDPVKFEDARHDMERRALMLVAMQGFGANSETAKDELFKLNSKVYGDQVESRLLAGKPFEAKGLMDANRTRIDKDVADKLDKLIKPAIDESEGTSVAIELSGRLRAGESYDVVRQDLQKRLKGKEKALNIAETQLAQDYVAIKDAKQETIRVARSNVEKIINDVESTGRVMSVKSLTSAPEFTNLRKADEKEAGNLLNEIRTRALAAEERSRAAEDRRKRIAKETKAEAEQRTFGTYASFLMNPDNLMQADVARMEKDGDLSLEQAKDLAKRKSEILTNPDKKSQLLTESALVKGIAKNASIKEGSEDYNLLIGKIEDERRAYRTQKGVDPDNKELESITRRQLGKVAVPGLFNDKKLFKMTLDDIPAKERQSIFDAYSRRGKVYTEKDVINAYVLKLEKKKQGGK